MAQTKLGSMAEVGLNLLVGYTVNFLANLVILPMFGFATLTVAKNLEIGVLFTIVSIARQYIIRRYFNGLKIFSEKRDAAR